MKMELNLDPCRDFEGPVGAKAAALWIIPHGPAVQCLALQGSESCSANNQQHSTSTSNCRLSSYSSLRRFSTGNRVDCSSQ